MSTLFKLKEWLTVPETANRLSGLFEEKILEKDVLRLALDGHLQLSVNFVNDTYGARCDIRRSKLETTKSDPISLPSNIDPCASDSEDFVYGCLLNNEDGLKRSGSRELLYGIYELTMLSSDKLTVEHKYHQLTNGPEVNFSCLSGPIVKNSKNEFFEIFYSSDSSHSNYQPALKLPDDSVLIVKQDAMTALENTLARYTKNAGKSLAARERNTLLLIIGALLKQKNISWTERGAAAKVAAFTETTGAPVSEEKILQVLRQIPGAIERRSK